MNTSLINIDEIYEEAKADADDEFLVKQESEQSEEQSSSLSEDEHKEEYLLKGETFMNIGPLEE